MWRDKFNLGPERESQNEELAASIRPQDEQETPEHVYYGGFYEDLFEVTMYISVAMINGETIPIGLRITVPDYDLGALCETLHFNGISYQCELIPPEEGEHDQS